MTFEELMRIDWKVHSKPSSKRYWESATPPPASMPYWKPVKQFTKPIRTVPSPPKEDLIRYLRNPRTLHQCATFNKRGRYPTLMKLSRLHRQGSVDTDGQRYFAVTT